MHGPEWNRLRWRCRRGMLELDLMLLPFVEQQFSRLSRAERRSMERLLDYPDQVLLEWLQGDGETHDRELNEIVKKVRQLTVS
jgi:antitoxin CptB